MKQKVVKETKNTIHKPLRIPKWIVEMCKGGNVSGNLIELMEIGAVAKHGADLVEAAKEQ